jgi:hypothetical protein
VKRCREFFEKFLENFFGFFAGPCVKKLKVPCAFSCRSGAAFFNAIVIVIEMLIRINQTLLKIFQADFDEKFLSRPCS